MKALFVMGVPFMGVMLTSHETKMSTEKRDHFKRTWSDPSNHHSWGAFIAVNFPEEVYLEMHFGAQARPQNASDDQDDMRCLGFFRRFRQWIFICHSCWGRHSSLDPTMANLEKNHVSIFGLWRMAGITLPETNSFVLQEWWLEY